MLLNKRISVIYFLKLIKGDVVIITLYAILASKLDQDSIFKNVSIPLSIPGIIGTLVSLLLAFRISQSYERWWEARIVWGAIVNDSRSLLRQVQQFLPENEAATQAAREMAERQTVWCYALGESLRQFPYSDKVKNYAEDHAISAGNLPNALLDAHARQWRRLCEQFQVNVNKQVQVDATLVKLTDSMGRCERIKNTIFPRSYSLLIHFLIYVFLTILPFGIEQISILPEIGLSIMIPTLFISIEQTAIIMQDPFENRPTDTPMTKLAQTIENNLREMTGQSPVAQESTIDTYYVM